MTGSIFIAGACRVSYKEATISVSRCDDSFVHSSFRTASACLPKSPLAFG
jgi:hypothetical protein